MIINLINHEVFNNDYIIYYSGGYIMMTILQYIFYITMYNNVYTSLTIYCSP